MDINFNANITPSKHSVEGDKRQYISKILEWQCPNCGENQIFDFSDQYLSYPIIPSIFKHYLHCSNCDSEFSINLKIDYILEIVGGEE